LVASHDYVEAALIRRAGWKVWIGTGLAGNYEEGPTNLIDLAQRDRRWLQGSLQHARLEVARGFHPVNRMHFALGILSYLASPLWLAFPTISAVIADRCASTGPLLLPVRSFAAFLHWSFRGQVARLLGVWRATLGSWEANHYEPTGSVRARVIAWLGFDPIE